MTARQIWKSAHDEKFIFVLYDSEYGVTAYGIVLADPMYKHLVGYLNLDKDKWLEVADKVRDADDISFEGIESTRLSIPVDFNKTVPITIWHYWIGIDHMEDKRLITPQDVAEELLIILNHVEKECQRF